MLTIQKKLQSASKLGSTSKNPSTRKTLRSPAPFIGPLPAPSPVPPAPAVVRALFPGSPPTAASATGSNTSPSKRSSSPMTPSAQVILDMFTKITESNAAVGNPVELKPWDSSKQDYKVFKDNLTRWAANGLKKELPKDKRNSLIVESTVSVIEMHMLAKLGNIDKSSWRALDNEDFFTLMAFLFKEGRKDESLAEQIRTLIFRFQLDKGYMSLTEFFTKLRKLREQYEPGSRDSSVEAQKQQVDAVFKLFPRDKIHMRLEDRINKHGKPKNLDEFESACLKEASALYNCHVEMLSCGQQLLPSDSQPNGSFKKNKKRSFNEYTKGQENPTHTTDLRPDNRYHNGCGHIHPGVECALKQHPDYNNTDLPWNKSAKGLAWREQGWYQLPYNRTLDPNAKWTPPPLPTSNTKSPVSPRAINHGRRMIMVRKFLIITVDLCINLNQLKKLVFLM